MSILSAETAVAIAVAHQEIARGEKLLGDVCKSLKERNGRGFGVSAESDLRDVFGRRQNSLQLGIPSGSNGHQICDMSYDLAVPVIEAHINNKRAQLAALSLKAKAELSLADQNRAGPTPADTLGNDAT